MRDLLAKAWAVAKDLVEEGLGPIRQEHQDLLRLEELAREAVEVWQAGSSRYDGEDFDLAMSDLAHALPPKPHAPIEVGPDDPF
jgi:hypothetical protein